VVREIDKLQFNLQNLTFATSPNRINELKFEGAVCKIGKESQGIPGGAWTQVVLEKSAVEAAVKTMVDMPVTAEWPTEYWENPAYVFTGHNSRFCIGTVQKAWIDGENLMCAGIIWRDNFYDVSTMLLQASESIGFSIECFMLKHGTGEDGFEHVTEIEFCGVCICWKNLAAFEGTMLTKLVATKNLIKKEGTEMELKDIQEMMDAAVAKLEASNAELVNGLKLANEDLQKQVDELNAKLEAANAEKADAQVAFEAEKLELNTKLEAAAAAIPAPTANLNSQVPAPKDKINAVEEYAKINKMTCSPEEKAQLRFAVWAKVSK